MNPSRFLFLVIGQGRACCVAGAARRRGGGEGCAPFDQRGAGNTKDVILE